MGQEQSCPYIKIFTMDRLDYYDILPSGMDAYLSNYGWHFSKKMCMWAIKNMRDRNDRPLNMLSYEQIDNLLATYGVKLSNDKGYDKVFVAHMCISDFKGSSVPNDEQVAKYVKDVLDDKDGYEGIAFSRFLADCNGKGVPIIWEDMI